MCEFFPTDGATFAMRNFPSNGEMLGVIDMASLNPCVVHSRKECVRMNEICSYYNLATFLD